MPLHLVVMIKSGISILGSFNISSSGGLSLKLMLFGTHGSNQSSSVPLVSFCNATS